jgi:hypothetical protein
MMDELPYLSRRVCGDPRMHGVACSRMMEVDSIESLVREEDVMHATIRRYEAIDQTRISELVEKAEACLIPRMSKLPGFIAYYLIEGCNGVVTSVNFFDTAAHAEESSHVVSDWLREEMLKPALPNPAQVTFGEVVAQETRVLVEA